VPVLLQRERERETIGFIQFIPALIPIFTGGAVAAAVVGPEALAEAVADILEDVPLTAPIYGVIKDAVEGPLRDFARTDIGRGLLRSVATAVMMMGPGAVGMGVAGMGLAMAANAAPGLLRGEELTDAMVTEFAWRLAKTAEVYGGELSTAIGEQAKELYPQLIEAFGIEEIAENAQELAERFGVREDVAEFARQLWNGLPPNLRDFSYLTGKQRGAVGAYDMPIRGISDALSARRARSLQSAASWQATELIPIDSATRWARYLTQAGSEPQATEEERLPVAEREPASASFGTVVALLVGAGALAGGAWYLWGRR
jgi:hypothetical protein